MMDTPLFLTSLSLSKNGNDKYGLSINILSCAVSISFSISLKLILFDLPSNNKKCIFSKCLEIKPDALEKHTSNLFRKGSVWESDRISPAAVWSDRQAGGLH